MSELLLQKLNKN